MAQGTWYTPVDAQGKAFKDKEGKAKPGRGYLCSPVGCASCLVSRGWFNLATGWGGGKVHVWFIGTAEEGTPEYLYEEERQIAGNTRHGWGLPDGTDQIGVEFFLDDPSQPLGWATELESR